MKHAPSLVLVLAACTSACATAAPAPRSEPARDGRWAQLRALAAELPESAFGQLGMARTYLAWNTLDQADHAIAAALETEPDCWLAVLVRAQVAERRERFPAAAADYRAVLQADPESPDAHLG